MLSGQGRMGSRNAEDYDDYGQDELIGDIEAMLVSPIQETPPNRFGSNVKTERPLRPVAKLDGYNQESHEFAIAELPAGDVPVRNEPQIAELPAIELPSSGALDDHSHVAELPAEDVKATTIPKTVQASEVSPVAGAFELDSGDYRHDTTNLAPRAIGIRRHSTGEWHNETQLTAPSAPPPLAPRPPPVPPKVPVISIKPYRPPTDIHPSTPIVRPASTPNHNPLAGVPIPPPPPLPKPASSQISTRSSQHDPSRPYEPFRPVQPLSSVPPPPPRPSSAFNPTTQTIQTSQTFPILRVPKPSQSVPPLPPRPVPSPPSDPHQSPSRLSPPIPGQRRYSTMSAPHQSPQTKLSPGGNLSPPALSPTGAVLLPSKPIKSNSVSGKSAQYLNKAKEAAVQAAQDITSITKASIIKDGLCSSCHDIPVLSLISGSTDQPWISPMRRIIANRGACRFCDLLLQAMCDDEFDPFNHPRMFEHRDRMPDPRNSQMRSWLMSRTSATELLVMWPFGQSETQEGNPPSSTLSNATRQGIPSAMGVLDRYSGKPGSSSRDSSPSPNKTLPCYCEILPAKSLPGTLTVKLWGNGPGPAQNIAILSQFNLRIESNLGLPKVSPQTPLSYGRKIDPLQIDLAIGRSWLQNCELNHGHICTERSWPFSVGETMFLRLIDVKDLRLVEIPREHIASTRYVALSYRWGSSNTISLTAHNKGQFHSLGGLATVYNNKTLPATLRDAMLTVWSIGEKYLWADVLCIQQDNSVEKNGQIDEMHRIFGHALVTIVAADATEASGGLSGLQPNSRNIKQLSTKLLNGVDVFVPLPEPRGLNLSPWNIRSWTLQERLLSRRLLIFLGGQVIWRCRDCAAFEDMTAIEKGRKLETFNWLSIQPHHLGFNSQGGRIDGSLELTRDGRTVLVRSDTFKEYADMVRRYTLREMTCSSDALKAFAGLLHVLESNFKCTIVYGIPEILVDAALLWRPAPINQTGASAQLVRRSSSDGITPSWSWAGFQGKIEYEEPFQVGFDENGYLQKIPDENGQERFRPLLSYYIWRDGMLYLLNGTGYGIPLVLNQGERPPAEWDHTPERISVAPLQWFNLSGPVRHRLDARHLIFQTSCSKTFAFQPEQGPVPPGSSIRQTLIDTSSGALVGNIQLDGGYPQYFNREWHDLMIISEAQYFGVGREIAQPDDDDNTRYLLYNVMLIEWDSSREFAHRLGLGRIYKGAWKESVFRIVILE